MKATDILRTEHRHIGRMLDIMEHAAARIDRGDDVATALLRDAIEFFKTFVDGCHYRKEEALLFPALARNGLVPEAGSGGILLHEHDLAREGLRGTHHALLRYTAGDPDAAMDLVARTKKFVISLRNHIVKEDVLLFVMANQCLSSQEQATLANAFEEIEGTDEACLMKEDLIVLLERMERAFALQENG